MENAFMKSVLIWKSLRFGEPSHRIRHTYTFIHGSLTKPDSKKRSFERMREMEKRERRKNEHRTHYNTTDHIHSNWNLHIKFAHVMNTVWPKCKFYGIISDFQQWQYLNDTHTHTIFVPSFSVLSFFGFFSSSNHCWARWHRSMRGIFASSAEVNYRAVWTQSQLRLRLRLWKCQCELWIMTIFHRHPTKWFAPPTNQYVSLSYWQNETNLIALCVQRRGRIYVISRIAIRFNSKSKCASFTDSCSPFLSHLL